MEEIEISQEALDLLKRLYEQRTFRHCWLQPSDNAGLRVLASFSLITASHRLSPHMITDRGLALLNGNLKFKIKSDMKKQLFMVAILWHPTAAEIEAGQNTLILVAPLGVVASSAKHAEIQALQVLGADINKFKADQLEVLIRPF